jgi:glycosidase
MPQVHYPSLYQVNTRVWLRELGRDLGRPATLGEVPDAALDRLADLGFDWLWLLGVWQTGAAGQKVSLSHPEWRLGYAASLPDFTEADVCGSPYAVQSYTVHAEYGSGDSLLQLRERLRQRGLKLLLDFVPNHTALDHRWVGEWPEFYVQGTQEDLARDPHSFRLAATERGPVVLAHGRDPYFPAWPDTFQLNYRHPVLREAMIEELIKVGRLCDGVRCDMAMLLLPGVIAATWGDRALPRDGTPPVDAPFWPEAIARVRRHHPDFLFMAEVYWDLEWALQQQGFDYTYDKRHYDRLRGQDAAAVRGHLGAAPEFQQRSVRFVENHDEPRAAAVFPPQVYPAAAVLTFLVPGMRFFQDGQIEGNRAKGNLHLCRRPQERPDPVVQEFYGRLLTCLQRPEVRDGQWQPLGCRAGWDGNTTWTNFVAFAWEQKNGRRLLVAVNYGPARGQCYVSLPWAGLGGKQWVLRDLTGPARYERDGSDLARRGLYLDMPEWGYHVFEVTAAA